MNDTFSTSNLRSTSPFQSLQRDAVEAKAQIRHYKQHENFIGMVLSDSTLEEKVTHLFVKKASKGHIDKLLDIISKMTHDEMYETYVEHMEYVGDLPGLARLFTYRKVTTDFNFANG
ncbi:hypothetical protein EVJ32_04730 [Exiguobacterium sp. SH5S4]|uniref:hypothetical protein n=1 Tax=Exiguobacterium sp. SH5S4 TaxID=2510961 RepID=UPI00104069BD|nr:hypothetical protein [Exiguobacterium sp. SH5S4]TCI26683.1 hypothetical protein EVJ32_04730 [Exiguobacterium sp. SH5S4]